MEFLIWVFRLSCIVSEMEVHFAGDARTRYTAAECLGRSLLNECALIRYLPPIRPELLVSPSEEYIAPNLMTGLQNVVLVSG